MNVRALVRWGGHGLVWLVLLGAGAALTVGLVVPRVGGATPYAVLTDSMEPSMPSGTLVVVRPRDADEIGIGSVITFQLKSGEPKVVTHRVVAVGVDSDGERRFRTQGDANDTPDPAWILERQVRGEVWYDVPYLGHAHALLASEQRQLGSYGVAAALLAYAAFMFATAARDRSRRRADGEREHAHG